jgi:histidine triad (HIT) family protein
MTPTPNPQLVDDCLFCRIIAGQLPTTPIYEDAHVLAFNDLASQAPTHVLVVPKVHVTGLTDPACTPDILAAVMVGVQQTAKVLKLTQFRTVINTGADAGQSVFHWHVHLLAGRPFTWPPG